MSWRNNNGGWNKKNGTVEETPRLDSFALPGWDGLWCDGLRYRFPIDFDGDTCWIRLPWGWDEDVQISRKRNGYGGEQVFWLCPFCGGRVRYLYWYGKMFCCRKCAELNYHSQQKTKDITDAYQQGMKYAEKYLKAAPSDCPGGFAFDRYRPARPSGMHSATYDRHLRKLEQYKDRYAAAWIGAVDRLLKRYQVEEDL